MLVANLKLAEFGSVSVAGLTSTIGFGSIEKGVSERSQQDFYEYDVARSRTREDTWSFISNVNTFLFERLSSGCNA